MPITITRRPTAIWVQNDWSSTLGAGAEVAVVTDGNNGTAMVTGEGALQDLLYSVQKIDAPNHCPIRSCQLLARTAHPTVGATMYIRARVGGVLYTGGIWEAGTWPVLLNNTDEFAALVTTVGHFNAAQFGCYANWFSGGLPPSLVELNVRVTYLPPPSGFVSLVA